MLSFRVWKTVPEQHICTYEYKLAPPNPRPISGRFQLNFTLEVNGCEAGTPVLYLEHVQVHATGEYSDFNLIFDLCTTFHDKNTFLYFSVRYSKRGDLKLTLFSPQGTRSVLLPPRPQASYWYFYWNNRDQRWFSLKRLILFSFSNNYYMQFIFCRTSTATASTNGHSCQCSSGAKTLEARGFSWSRASPTIPLLLVCSTIPFLLFLHSSFSLLFLI